MIKIRNFQHDQRSSHMNRYWFRKRRGLFSADLGYGWVPISIEGWISTVVFIGLLVFASFYYRMGYEDGRHLDFILALAAGIIGFSIFAHSKTDNSKK